MENENIAILIISIIIVSAFVGGIYYYKVYIPTQNVNNQKVELTRLSEITSYDITNSDVCISNGKPIVMFVGSSKCPYCNYFKPAFLEAIEPYKNNITLIMHFDTFNPDQTTQKVFENSNFNGGIPYINIACILDRTGMAYYNQENMHEKEVLELDKILRTVING